MAKSGTARVVIVGSTAAEGARLEATLASRSSLVVVRRVPRPSLARVLAETNPDVLVLALEPEEYRRALRELARAARPPAAVVLSDSPRRVWRADALKAGIRGVLPRQATPEEILAAIEGALANLVVLHPDAVRPVAAVTAAGGADLEAAPETLTPREAEVLGMLAEGLGNKAIAARLGISDHTVKFHVASILAKLSAATRTEAVTLGLRNGLILV